MALCLGLGTVVATGMAPTPVAARSMADTLRRTGLTQQDINILSQTAATLYREGTPKVGAEKDWSNPDTGNSGKAMLGGFDGKCADVRHVVITQRRPEPQDFTFRNCKTADGSWIMVP
ncbi:MAG: hypothetical protein CML65_23215 [Rhodobacteraceae bacterium]|nr:hypothetical protein [Paracoccaceae bacterium]